MTRKSTGLASKDEKTLSERFLLSWERPRGTPARDPAIDMIKAICISLVLIWHLQPITKPMMRMDSAVSVLVWLSVGFFYRYVALLAVPTLICVSIMLFIKKSSFGGDYWRKRLPRLIKLFLFWTSVQIVFFLLVGGELPVPLRTIVPDGGPGLPYVGTSVFYFLFVLVVCTVTAALFLRLSDRIRCVLGGCIIILSCLDFFISSHYRIPIKITSMENYCIYVPIAYYAVKYPERLVRYRILLAFGYLVAIGYEVLVTGGISSSYGRLSVVFGVLTLTSVLLSTEFGGNPVAEFLSRYSLGIYCVHKYWQYTLMVFFAAIGLDTDMGSFSEKLVLVGTTVGATLASVFVLSKTRLRTLVS